MFYFSFIIFLSKYCPIPSVRYTQLEDELFCNIYYLRHLCDVQKYPDWPIKEPVRCLNILLNVVLFLYLSLINYTNVNSYNE